jgi:hypothetical protein
MGGGAVNGSRGDVTVLFGAIVFSSKWHLSLSFHHHLLMSSTRDILARAKAHQTAANQTTAQQLNRGSSPITSRGGIPSDGPIHNDEDQSASSSPNVRLVPPLPAFFPGGIVARTNTVQLKAAGEHALKRFKVNDKTAAEYRRYLEVCLLLNIPLLPQFI